MQEKLSLREKLCEMIPSFWFHFSMFANKMLLRFTEITKEEIVRRALEIII